MGVLNLFFIRNIFFEKIDLFFMTKKCENFKLIFILTQLPEMHGVGRVIFSSKPIKENVANAST